MYFYFGVKHDLDMFLTGFMRFTQKGPLPFDTNDSSLSTLSIFHCTHLFVCLSLTDQTFITITLTSICAMSQSQSQCNSSL